MPRTHYCHPVDPLRVFDPQLSMSDLESNGYIGSQDDEDRVLAALEDAESEFDSLTRNPQREVRVGVPGEPATFEHQSADLRRNQNGVKVWLDNTHVTPIDPDEGDSIEIRTGRDSWRDITNESDRWEFNYRDGWVRFFSRLHRSMYRQSARDRIIRICYRHGALGGDPHSAGQTTLTSGVTSGDSTAEVDDYARLPQEGLLLVDGSEYVSARRGAGGTLELNARGIRGTTDQDHESGSVVHFCPSDVRKAVAHRAAIELLTYDDWVHQLVDTDHGIQSSMKTDEWKETWEKTLSKYSGARLV